MAISKHRYFSGNTKNPDGSVQFRAGKTKVSNAIDGAIKIVTVAVCAKYWTTRTYISHL